MWSMENLIKRSDEMGSGWFFLLLGLLRLKLAGV